VTIGGVVVAIGTALIASTYSNLMNYLQALFSIFNAPLFATFIIGMFWKRMTSTAALWGLIAGTLTALFIYVGYKFLDLFQFGSDLDESFWGAGMAFAVDAVVTVAVTYLGKPKPREELRGLVWGMSVGDTAGVLVGRGQPWWESPALLGAGALIAALGLTIVFF
jgi:SSS family solute:Na+ symporter